MDTSENLEEAVGILQQLGLKEYEARCFVGLNRLETGTAKQLSEVTEVPRTRIYDAIRVLEGQGLVEVHHSSPQQYRAVPLEEASKTLRDQYHSRIERLETSLETVEIVDTDEEEPVQQVWAMTGRNSIGNRANQLITEATDEVVIVISDGHLLTDEFVETCNEISNGVELIIGTVTKPLEDEIYNSIPGATTFVSGLEWLQNNGDTADTAIGRLLLVDRSTILVSTIQPDTKAEQAIFGEGFGNGLIVIARRLISQGLLSVRDPGQTQA